MIIGIDPSINCTGVCVWDGEDDNIYYMVVGKSTKKMENFQSEYIYIKNYNKIQPEGDYSNKEYIKTNNIYKICNELKNILLKYKPEMVIMEGISYGSVGSAALVDLAGLNFMIRYMMESIGVPYKIVPPTSVKKSAVANGQADKYIMIDAWKRLDRNIYNINEIKLDDLADSYFLAHYQE